MISPALLGKMEILVRESKALQKAVTVIPRFLGISTLAIKERFRIADCCGKLEKVELKFAN
jgi:hypothetical protein